MYLRPDPESIESEFLLHSIYGPVIRRYIDIACNGSTVGHLRLGQIGAMPLLWCPLKEQLDIVAHIAHACTNPNTAISNLEREITLLREYRTRLTADVVTGKLDVRREKGEEGRVKGEGDWGKEDEAEALETEEGGEDE